SLTCLSIAALNARFLAGALSQSSVTMHLRDSSLQSVCEGRCAVLGRDIALLTLSQMLRERAERLDVEPHRLEPLGLGGDPVREVVERDLLRDQQQRARSVALPRR